MQYDTIAAIATPPGVGGIGVIRVSGPDAFAAVLPLLKRPGDKSSAPASHQLTYGQIIDPATREPIDEVLVAFMYAPRSYTCEDVVEIHGHGGPFILQRILKVVLAQGVRIANPGEFTMRAFLNGRLDLAQAEAVMDLIGSETETGRRLAMQQFRGLVSSQVQQAQTTILGSIARIEASIDFPEEDVPTPNEDELAPIIDQAEQQVDRLLAGADQGRLYRQGLRVVILGRPNVGKSSLLNAMLRMERAIVTPIAGTTRDTVEEAANIQGIPLHLIDTAGITTSDDPIEQIGVERSRAAAASADVLLLVFDASEPITELDRQVIAELKAFRDAQDQRPLLLVLNKADQPPQLEKSELVEIWPGTSIVSTSTREPEGIGQLEQGLADLVLKGQTLQSENVLVTSVRHQEALHRSLEHLRAAKRPLAQGLPLDFVSIDLRAAYEALGEITGETASEDLLDRIFQEFCIGK